MQEGNQKIAEWLEQERSEREKQKTELQKHLQECIAKLDQRMKDFSQSTINKFDMLQGDTMKEIDS